ncbi:hypothetical protein SAMN05444358_10458 [Ruegeria halocynthiae]|uniref:EF hand n=1 Tax=Ruegeria halocynthiae TaxID=985054 RepID=A0A1H3A658_9RHOB|nr:hypothetical protein [Ruegeria halocynthiae]SDX25126.1 hypothetical protein SAMN05444358_10458 [Ruegeria halocynthiae]
MRNLLINFGLGASILLSFSTEGLAASYDDDLQLALEISGWAGRHSNVADLKQEVLFKFFRNDIDDKPGISEADFELLAAIHNSGGWAQLLSNKIKRDLNGDYIITEEELRPAFLYKAQISIDANGVRLRPTSEQVEQIVREHTEEFMRADSNGDRSVTLDELKTYHESISAQYTRKPHDFIPMLPTLNLDYNLDGAVSEGEFSNFTDSVVLKMDQNDDGRIDSEERGAFRELLRVKLNAQGQ